MTFSLPTVLAIVGTALMAIAIFAPRRAADADGAIALPPPPADVPATTLALPAPAELPRPRWPARVAPAAAGCDAAARIDLVDALQSLDSEWSREILRHASAEETDPDVRAAIDRRAALIAIATLPFLAAGSVAARAATGGTDWSALTDADWKRRLSPDAYAVLRHDGTETPFSSPLDHLTKPGTYDCAGCALPLFSSKTKYDSGTGWPSFWAPLPNAVATKTDLSLVVPRTEVHCRRCRGHLGHVFDDGPKPTGLRYCMNGVALAFRPSAS